VQKLLKTANANQVGAPDPGESHLAKQWANQLQMTSEEPPTTYRLSVCPGGERTARRLIDALSEIFEGEAAAGAFERPDARWEVTVDFAQAPDQALLRELLGNAVGAEIARTIAFETVAAKDWVKASLDDLVPVRAGRFIVYGQHDRARVPQNKLGIEIEAALAFGTGHHGTTRGCLLLLDEVLKTTRPRRVLDLGTGSGVLAVAAAMALRGRVLASDIDARCVRVARENARLNGVGDLLKVIRSNGFSAPDFAQHGPFDMVLANILANTLKQLAGPISAHLAPRALVILSGLLTPQAAGLIATYRARGLVPLRHRRIEGWSSLLLRAVG
jgi:ribosomal protein L11 methyltransferase